ncbi:heterokaryon incompatibility protein-domain-containing protein [Diaporthe sp. PMI_573]|nr:heterokaryon incompatibility protein-domain-containing protein [Diaporthaceae sp. PMI_573]
MTANFEIQSTDNLQCEDRFRHEPLLSDDAFRLLTIRGITSEGMIECAIRNECRTKCHRQYDCLSYSWGPPEPSHWIILSGKRFKVRENLFRFFESAVSSHDTIRQSLWTDAICIDQSNTTEVNQQVAQMDRIYQDARYVFVWLGLPRTEYSELSKYSREINGGPQAPGLGRGTGASNDVLTGNGDKERLVALELLDLFARDYWERMWIIQELTLAAEAILICGSESFPWKTIRVLMNHLESRHQRVRGDELDVEKFIAIQAFARPDIDDGPRVSAALAMLRAAHPQALLSQVQNRLVDLMLAYRRNKCFDPRDRAYALRGLAANGADLPVDYNATVEEMFFRILRIEGLDLTKANSLREAMQLEFSHLKDSLDTSRVPGGKHSPIRLPFSSVHRVYELGAAGTETREYCFDHEQSLGATEWILDPRDLVIVFGANYDDIGNPTLQRGVVLRQDSQGRHLYVAMCEIFSGRAGFSPWQRCFLYNLSELKNLPPTILGRSKSSLEVPVQVWMVLLKVCNLGGSIGHTNVTPEDLVSLGIQEKFIVSHTTTVHYRRSSGEPGLEIKSLSENDVREVYTGYSKPKFVKSSGG